MRIIQTFLTTFPVMYSISLPAIHGAPGTPPMMFPLTSLQPRFIVPENQLSPFKVWQFTLMVAPNSATMWALHVPPVIVRLDPLLTQYTFDIYQILTL